MFKHIFSSVVCVKGLEGGGGRKVHRFRVFFR